MGNKETYLGFISTENYRQQLDIWLRAYNVNHEKVQLFHDFLDSLYDILESTYLGEDVMDKEEEQKGHFAWCWNKTIQNFEKEKIYFKDTGTHFEYFWNFVLEAFYYPKLEGRNILVKEYFNRVFDFKHTKTRSELDILQEIYKLLNQNLKN